MSRPLILMYHRIAYEPVDYWGLAVSPGHFEEQLAVLRRTRRPVPLMEFVHRLVDGSLPADAVALTFDDGYADNLAAGLPRLAAADVPATVFVATGYIDRREPFWWDELARLILLESGPKRFEVVMNGQQAIHFELGVEPPMDRDVAKSVPWTKSRRDVLEAIYQPIRLLEEEERRAVILKLRSSFAERAGNASLPRAMTSKEVRTLASSGIVTIGAHTVTHPTLAELEVDACRYEITESKLACEVLIGAPVTAFAYPYGEFNAGTREVVKSAGFSFACSTLRGPALSTSDIFALPRIYVPDLHGDAFEQRVRWASERA
jgi:peptidoglycan/xylan/chitin deacetylase (PgdA/CDA1 family)